MRTISVANCTERAMVDDEDFDRIAKRRWYLHSQGYAASDEGSHKDGTRRTLLMHREVMEAPDRLEVDHVNLHKLNNQKANLRLCTHAMNMGNLGRKRGSQFKGVVRRTGRKSVYAVIGGQHLGAFDTEVEAAQAYDRAAVERYGEFARLNFPDESAA